MDSDGPPGVRASVPYVVDVGPGTTGVRVVVRHRLPGGGATDVLGELLSWQDGLLAVQRRDGSVRQIPEVDVLAAKRVPPAPPRRP